MLVCDQGTEQIASEHQWNWKGKRARETQPHSCFYTVLQRNSLIMLNEWKECPTQQQTIFLLPALHQIIDTRTTPPTSLHLGGSSVCSVYFYGNTVSKVCISSVPEVSLRSGVCPSSTRPTWPATLRTTAWKYLLRQTNENQLGEINCHYSTWELRDDEH